MRFLISIINVNTVVNAVITLNFYMILHFFCYVYLPASIDNTKVKKLTKARTSTKK